MVDSSIAERLKTLGVFTDTPAGDNARILEESPDLEAIADQLAKRHSACGEEQFVYFHLAALFQRDPGYKAQFLAEAQEKFGKTGISQAHIAEYFQSGGDPGLSFTLSHEDEYTTAVRISFYDGANQFALNKLKEWLGIPPLQA